MTRKKGGGREYGVEHDCLTREHDPDEWCPDCFPIKKGGGRESGESQERRSVPEAVAEAQARAKLPAADPAAHTEDESCPVCKARVELIRELEADMFECHTKLEVTQARVKELETMVRLFTKRHPGEYAEPRGEAREREAD